VEKKTDLKLSFDYENLHTLNEENAALLQKRLEAAGLTEGHGKQLNIIAHSMCGLNSRWHIEKRGGNKLVDKLIMFGRPITELPGRMCAIWQKHLLPTGSMAQHFFSHGWLYCQW
jgi:hypothetical protein